MKAKIARVIMYVKDFGELKGGNQKGTFRLCLNPCVSGFSVAPTANMTSHFLGI
jgi:hypothetical protein